MQAAEALVAAPVVEAGLTRPATEESRTRCARIAALDTSIAALTAERAALLVAERDSAVWKASGFPSFEAWRGHMSGEGLRTARTQVNVATVLAESPETSVALAAGEVTLVHAQVLGRVRKAADRTSAGALSADDHVELLDLARGQDADTFSKTADRWLARRDSVAHDATHEEIRRRRYLTISTTAAGTHVKGFLDEVAGRTLQLAVEAAMTRPGADDDRDYGQRCADALVDVAQVAIAGGTLKTGALVRPHVSLIMTEATFVEARRELRRRACVGKAAIETADAVAGAGGDAGLAGTPTHGSAPPGPSRPPGDTRAPGQVEPAIFEDGTPVPLNELARILCDAQVTRVVVDAEDVPVNLGRTARLYSGEQRRAIIARDRHCQFRGCTQPSRWCEVHHIDWWDRDGGETSIANGILLCVFHHHEVHKNNLTIRPDSTGAMVVRATRHSSAPPGTTTEPLTRAETGTPRGTGVATRSRSPVGAGKAGRRAAGDGAPRRTAERAGTGPGRQPDPHAETATGTGRSTRLRPTMEAVGEVDGQRAGRFMSQRAFEGW